MKLFALSSSSKIFCGLCLVLVMGMASACKKEGGSLKERQQAKAECPELIPARMNGHVYYVPRYAAYIGFKGKSQSKSCSNPPGLVHEADLIGFSYKVYNEEFDTDLVFRFSLDTSSQTVGIKRILEDLSEQGKTLSDLPSKDGFLEYKDISGLMTYIAIGEYEFSDKNNPLVLSLCPKGKSALDCTVSFMWESNINVIVRVLNYPRESLPMTDKDFWKKNYPFILDQLNNLK